MKVQSLVALGSFSPWAFVAYLTGAFFAPEERLLGTYTLHRACKPQNLLPFAFSSHISLHALLVSNRRYRQKFIVACCQLISDVYHVVNHKRTEQPHLSACWQEHDSVQSISDIHTDTWQTVRLLFSRNNYMTWLQTVAFASCFFGCMMSWYNNLQY